MPSWTIAVHCANFGTKWTPWGRFLPPFHFQEGVHKTCTLCGSWTGSYEGAGWGCSQVPPPTHKRVSAPSEPACQSGGLFKMWHCGSLPQAWRKTLLHPPPTLLLEPPPLGQPGCRRRRRPLLETGLWEGSAGHTLRSPTWPHPEWQDLTGLSHPPQEGSWLLSVSGLDPQLLQRAGESILWVVVCLCRHFTPTAIVLSSLLGGDCKPFGLLCLKTCSGAPTKKAKQVGGGGSLAQFISQVYSRTHNWESTSPPLPSFQINGTNLLCMLPILVLSGALCTGLGTSLKKCVETAPSSG